ncbi:hypothetical protein AV530_014259 [Patagioenas fasciata monilis]|uniref:Uncharacterized protein n=1 Tax=Patagioenas fasciata monilis TaxID=372326 RepID=A0A1V4KZT6_PATFA|nr:hypothetical protein AV530_014259 [Patagioenas fasciata monilis]
MTPSRANAFLTPNASWDFSKSPINITKKSSETVAQEPNLKSQVSPAAESIQEEQTTTSLKGDTANESDEKTFIGRLNETSPVSADTTTPETKSDDIKEQEHDVPYFRFVFICFTSLLCVQSLLT